MSDEGRKGLAVHVFLLVITLAVTFVVALLIAQDERTEGFYFTLAAILGLEVFGFLFPLFLALRDRRRKGVFRVDLGTTVFLSIYSVGVLILVLLAFGPVSFSKVVAVQLAWLLFFILALGANAMGIMGVWAKRKRAPFAVVRSQFAGFCDRLTAVQAKEALPLKAEFASVREELQGADPLREGEMVDAELGACLERMERELAALEAAVNPRNIVPASIPVEDAVSSLDWELKRMRRALRRHEPLVPVSVTGYETPK